MRCVPLRPIPFSPSRTSACRRRAIATRLPRHCRAIAMPRRGAERRALGYNNRQRPLRNVEMGRQDGAAYRSS
eukprot:10218265-Lingulodinium_polyedra.AAC.1